jgi:hypothetical protein
MATGLSDEFDVAGTYTLDQIADAVRSVSAPGKIGTVIVKTTMTTENARDAG